MREPMKRVSLQGVLSSPHLEDASVASSMLIALSGLCRSNESELTAKQIQVLEAVADRWKRFGRLIAIIQDQ